MLGHILRHIAHVGVLGPFYLAAVGREFALQDAQQGGFTHTIATDDGDFVPSIDHGGEFIDNRAIKGFADVLDFQSQAVQDLGLLKNNIRVLTR